MKALTLCFGLIMIAVSVLDIIYGDKVSGCAGLVFGIDQVQQVFTGHSLFSYAFAGLSALVWNQKYGNDKPFWDAFYEFNIWTPFSSKIGSQYRIMEAIWGIFFSIAMSKAINFCLSRVFIFIAKNLPWEAFKQWATAATKSLAAQRLMPAIAKYRSGEASMVEVSNMIEKSPGLQKAFSTLTGTIFTPASFIQQFPNLAGAFENSMQAFRILLRAGPQYFLMSRVAIILSRFGIVSVGERALSVTSLFRRVVGFFINPAFAMPASWMVGATALTSMLKLFATWILPSIFFSFFYGGTALGLFFALKASIDAGQPVGIGNW